jgi:DNA-binding NtrC family response regulator
MMFEYYWIWQDRADLPQGINRLHYGIVANETARPPVNVLIVDDEESQRNPLAAMIAAWGFVVEKAGDGQEALEKLSSFPANVIITDLMMPRMDGFELMKRLGADGNMPPAIVLTAFGNIETAIQTIHDLGAFWFLEKPIQPNALRILLERASAQSALAEETERLQRQLTYAGVLVDMVGTSPPMQQVFSLIRQVAPSKAPVLVSGESGTGKELVARAIHHISNRRSGPFVAINCAALPETLMESELFGHEKGAFTGALERRSGCFELAQHGSLLLDELGEMAVGTQAKLLRVLEDSRVRRLGGKSEISVDVRVIASTNRSVEEALKKGELREDLYYRLNVFQIQLPPLRQRMSDLPLLCETLIAQLNRKYQVNVTDLHPDVLEAFHKYQWPGNVRELRNVLERAAIVAGEGTIQMAHLPYDFGLSSGTRTTTQVFEPEMVHLPVGTTVSQGEKALIQLTLQHTKNNKTRAADILGISLKTLFNKLKEYGAEAEG